MFINASSSPRHSTLLLLSCLLLALALVPACLSPDDDDEPRADRTDVHIAEMASGPAWNISSPPRSIPAHAHDDECTNDADPAAVAAQQRAPVPRTSPVFRAAPESKVDLKAEATPDLPRFSVRADRVPAEVRDAQAEYLRASAELAHRYTGDELQERRAALKGQLLD